jgi:hypothetical protein
MVSKRENDSRVTGTFSLRQGKPGSKTFLECRERILLPEALNPGKAVQLQLFFALPQDATLEHWELDAVSESAFWFSDREIKSCPVPCL